METSARFSCILGNMVFQEEKKYIKRNWYHCYCLLSEPSHHASAKDNNVFKIATKTPNIMWGKRARPMRGYKTIIFTIVILCYTDIYIKQIFFYFNKEWHPDQNNISTSFPCPVCWKSLLSFLSAASTDFHRWRLETWELSMWNKH